MSTMPRYPSTSSEGDVQSVNGKKGDVVLKAEDLQAQPANQGLTQISQLTMPQNSFAYMGTDENFHPTSIMPVGRELLSKTSIEQQQAYLGISEVGKSGEYSSLLNKPATMPPSAHNHPISDISGLQEELNNKISTTAVLSYSSLSDKPLIPDPQVNSDWNANSGLSQILNKPTIPEIPVNVSSFNNDVGYLTSINTSLITSTLGYTPYNSTTNPAGYVTSTSLSSVLATYATTSALSSGLSSKLNVPTGSTTQYIRGDGSLANFPVIPSVNYPVTSVNGKTGSVVLNNTDVGAAPTSHTHGLSEITGLQVALDAKASLTAVNNLGVRRAETFLGTSDAAGNIAITFANTYSTPPDVQPQIIGGTFNQQVRVVSVSTTGCIVQAAQRNVVTLLGLEVLLGATVPLSGSSVTIQVTSRS